MAHADYIEQIDKKFDIIKPCLFGLHDNAEITTNQNATRSLCETLLSIQSKVASTGGKKEEEILDEIAAGIQKKVPNAWDMDEVTGKYPTMQLESMNTVLTQEVIRQNKLIKQMIATLIEFRKAVAGKVVMSEEFEDMGKMFMQNLVPNNWVSVSFLSLKPLSSQMIDFQERVKFIQGWIDNGI